jgi:MarR family transcriptional regulator, transcriptional regulator for hemolysin
MARPREEPIGLVVVRTAKALSRAFDEALASAGGSLPTWLVLVSRRRRAWGTQRELAQALGIEGPTLSHHLDGLEGAGLVTRTRNPDNRRVQRVELTEAGEAAFQRLRRAAGGFDQRLRFGLGEDDLHRFRGLLAQLRANVTDKSETAT